MILPPRFAPLRDERSFERSQLAGHFYSIVFMKYDNYLKSEHWSDVKQRYKSSKLNRKKLCKMCYRDLRLDLHHITYKRIGQERLQDLLQICRECHKIVHRKQVDNVRQRTKLIKHRMKKWIQGTYWEHGKKTPRYYILPSFMQYI